MTCAYIATLAHLRHDPFQYPEALEIIERGALWVDDNQGRIVACGDAGQIQRQLPPEAEIVDFGQAWLLPGLIDAHLHFPQYYVVAAPNRGLLSWLQESVYPAELVFGDPLYAAEVADALVSRLLQSGVTTAVMFGSQFPEATGTLFEAARRRGLCLIAGITLMDRDGPAPLRTDPETAWRTCEQLMQRCGDDPRLHYALTPRFALSCSPELLRMCGEFRRRYPKVYLQTHINETQEEVEAVLRAFPDALHYLDVYDRFGLLGRRTLLVHNIHPQGSEMRALAESGSSVCHCPSSNLFLGSGLFPLRRHVQHGIPLAMGTDIGAGLHFWVWEELSECYRIQRLQGESPTVAQLLYLVTLGAARALALEAEIGNFAPGKTADFWVLDVADDPYLNQRLRRCQSLEEQLFVLMHLARPEHCRAVFAAGRPCTKEASES